jgi:hypothetical protein
MKRGYSAGKSNCVHILDNKDRSICGCPDKIDVTMTNAEVIESGECDDCLKISNKNKVEPIMKHVRDYSILSGSVKLFFDDETESGFYFSTDTPPQVVAWLILNSIRENSIQEIGTSVLSDDLFDRVEQVRKQKNESDSLQFECIQGGTEYIQDAVDDFLDFLIKNPKANKAKKKAWLIEIGAIWLEIMKRYFNE